MPNVGSGSSYKIKPRQLRQAKKYKVHIEVADDKSKKIDVYELKKKKTQEELDKMTPVKRKYYLKEFPKKKHGKKLASIGGLYDDGTPYGDYASYLIKGEMPKSGLKVDADEQRRKYLARHSLEPKEKVNEKTGKMEKTPSYWADRILWE